MVEVSKNISDNVSLENKKELKESLVVVNRVTKWHVARLRSEKHFA